MAEPASALAKLARADLRVVPDQPIDIVAAERAAADLLRAFGLDLTDETLAGTPRRMVHGYAELLTRREFTLTTFANDERYDELVLARSIPFTSVCEHHMLPFTGTATAGYLPGDRILGLSKRARVVELFARRPQVQERLTTQIARWLDTHLRPKGVGVVVEARALEVPLPADYAEQRLEFADGLSADMTSSTHHDLERGNRLEVPWLSGGVVDLGRTVGVETPLNCAVADALAIRADA